MLVTFRDRLGDMGELECQVVWVGACPHRFGNSVVAWVSWRIDVLSWLHFCTVSGAFERHGGVKVSVVWDGCMVGFFWEHVGGLGSWSVEFWCKFLALKKKGGGEGQGALAIAAWPREGYFLIRCCECTCCDARYMHSFAQQRGS